MQNLKFALLIKKIFPKLNYVSDYHYNISTIIRVILGKKKLREIGALNPKFLIQSVIKQSHQTRCLLLMEYHGKYILEFISGLHEELNSMTKCSECGKVDYVDSYQCCSYCNCYKPLCKCSLIKVGTIDSMDIMLRRCKKHLYNWYSDIMDKPIDIDVRFYTDFSYFIIQYFSKIIENNSPLHEIRSFRYGYCYNFIKYKHMLKLVRSKNKIIVRFVDKMRKKFIKYNELFLHKIYIPVKIDFINEKYKKIMKKRKIKSIGIRRPSDKLIDISIIVNIN